MALGLSAARPAEVTIGSLLREMADRSVLARYPAPEYRTRQASSYDRASVQPGEASWFANWDRSQFLRTDSVQGRREFVLLAADGPGAVVRFWATVADYGGQGTLRMYFDHDTVPAIEGEVLSLLSGGCAGTCAAFRLGVGADALPATGAQPVPAPAVCASLQNNLRKPVHSRAGQELRRMLLLQHKLPDVCAGHPK